MKRDTREKTQTYPPRMAYAKWTALTCSHQENSQRGLEGITLKGSKPIVMSRTTSCRGQQGDREGHGCSESFLDGFPDGYG
jgi:hypothetical protein